MVGLWDNGCIFLSFPFPFNGTILSSILPLLLATLAYFSALLACASNRFEEVTEWTDKPTVKVAVTVDAPEVVKMLMDRLISS